MAAVLGSLGIKGRSAGLWLGVPMSLTPSSPEVHVWRARLGAANPSFKSRLRTLSQDGIGKEERLRHGAFGDRFVVSEGLLWAILGRLLDAMPAQSRFKYRPEGKPASAAHTGASGIRFGLSRSRHPALYTVERRRRIGSNRNMCFACPRSETLRSGSHPLKRRKSLVPLLQAGNLARSSDRGPAGKRTSEQETRGVHVSRIGSVTGLRQRRLRG